MPDVLSGFHIELAKKTEIPRKSMQELRLFEVNHRDTVYNSVNGVNKLIYTSFSPF